MGSRRRFSVRSMMGLVLAAALGFGALRSHAVGALLIAVAVTSLLAHTIFKVANIRFTWPRAAAYVVAVLALPCVGAALLSQAMWGYPFERPGVDPRIFEVRHVESVTSIKTVEDGRGGWRIVAETWKSFAPPGRLTEQDYSSQLGGRLVVALQDQNLLPENPRPMAEPDLDRLFGLLDATGKLEAGEPRYEKAKSLDGFVIEAIGEDGKPWLFVAAQGGEVSSDQHPYYEFLFDGKISEKVPSLVGFQRFYFDMGVIEGVGWPLFFFVFWGITMLVAVPLSMFIAVVYHHRTTKANISVQNYQT